MAKVPKAPKSLEMQKPKGPEVFQMKKVRKPEGPKI